MSNALSTTWPSGSTNQGWPQEPTGMLMPGRIQGWPAGTQRAANPATTLLSQAVAWWDVEQYREGDRFLRNRGTGGELLDLRLGSANVANSNEPLYLPSEDSGYVFLPGVAGNFLSIADNRSGTASTWQVSALVNNGQQAASVLFSRASSASALMGAVMQSSGSNVRPRLQWMDGGNTQRTTAAAATNPLPGGVTWIRFTVDASGANTVATFESAPPSETEPTTWTTVVTESFTGVTGITIPNVNARVGELAYTTGNPFAGSIYRVIERIDGTTVLDIDCDAITSGSNTSFLSVGNQTVTVNRSTSGRKTVCVPSRHKGGKPVMLLGTDDFLAIPDENGWQDALTTVLRQGQSYTVMAIVRHWPTLNRLAGLIGADVQTSGVNRWNLATTTSGGGVQFFTVDASNASAQASGSTSGGTVQTYCGVMDANSQTIYTANNGTSGAPATLKSFSGMTRRFTLNVGRFGSANHFDGEFFGALVDRRAWSLAEIKTVADYFTGRIA